MSANRLLWLASEIHKGRLVFVSFSFNPQNRREKITFHLEDVYTGSNVYRPCIMAALSAIQLALTTSVVTDKAHKSHSTGSSIVEFWIRQPPPKPEPGLHSIKPEICVNSMPQGSGISSFQLVDTTEVTMGKEMMDTTVMLGTPEFHCAEDPIAEVPPARIDQSELRIIKKDDWRYCTWTGLQTVTSNFDAFSAVIARLGAASDAPVSSLHDASVQCQAILGIAQAQLQELIDMDLSNNNTQDKLDRMRRGDLMVGRLMERSDKMRSRLIALAGTREVQGFLHGSPSGATASAATEPSSADISATQRLMAPKSGKAQQSNRKPPKRSGAPALSRNSEGKHARR